LPKASIPASETAVANSSLCSTVMPP